MSPRAWRIRGGMRPIAFRALPELTGVPVSAKTVTPGARQVEAGTLRAGFTVRLGP